MPQITATKAGKDRGKAGTADAPTFCGNISSLANGTSTKQSAVTSYQTGHRDIDKFYHLSSYLYLFVLFSFLVQQGSLVLTRKENWTAPCVPEAVQSVAWGSQAQISPGSEK
jgi:hypothetical protein